MSPRLDIRCLIFRLVIFIILCTLPISLLLKGTSFARSGKLHLEKNIMVRRIESVLNLVEI
jgi:hypothetical protein